MVSYAEICSSHANPPVLLIHDEISGNISEWVSDSVTVAENDVSKYGVMSCTGTGGHLVHGKVVVMRETCV